MYSDRTGGNTNPKAPLLINRALSHHVLEPCRSLSKVTTYLIVLKTLPTRAEEKRTLPYDFSTQDMPQERGLQCLYATVHPLADILSRISYEQLPKVSGLEGTLTPLFEAGLCCAELD